MSLRTLMQAGPTKANELFAQLAETSDGAVKTREKLFAELKAELELHASLEEHHLFPVLKRNPDTRELVGEAIRDNKQLRTRLAELDALPKTDESFLGQVKELQKAFRQHARDEKRELLPAVQRALSDEQIHKVEEKMEAGAAEAERVRHEDVQARRADAQRERDQADEPVARQTPSALQVAAHAETDALSTIKAGMTAAQQEAREAAAAASNLQSAAPMTAGPVGMAFELGFRCWEVVGQATAARATFAQQVFWHSAERQARFARDMSRWWIARNRSLVQLAMTPFIGNTRL